VENKQNRVSCPVGLSILAAINILSSLILFIPVLVTPFLVFFKEWSFEEISIIHVIIRVMFSILYFISAIGYLKVRWYQGYVLGNIISVVALLSIGFSVALKDTVSSDLIHKILIKLMFPIITLLLLNIRYRRLFKDARIETRL